jgi:hypothetical protein
MMGEKGGGEEMGENANVRDAERLPPAYRLHGTVDLKKDKRYAAAVQAIFVLVAIAAGAAGIFLDLPLASSWSPLLSIPVTVAACFAYMALHEATHGAAVQMLTKVRPSYAVRFPFLTTGTEAYLTRRTATVVALAPVVLWGAVILAALLTVPIDFRLTVYVLLALNLAGSAGDGVEAFVVSRQRRDALLQDDGDKLHIFVPGPH